MKEKEIKKYVFESKNGMATIRLLEKDKNGRVRSASCEYPLTQRVFNENSQKYETKRLTKKQTEKYLLSLLGLNA